MKSGSWLMASVLVCLTCGQLAAQAPRQAPAAKGPAAKAAAVDPAKTKILESVDTKFQTYDSVQKQIWGFAEVGYQEEKSSALLQSQLKAAGFTIQTGVADEPTAFVASFGSGKPIIGILSEFDALPGLSQEAGNPERKPVVEGGAGHGCGHHLYGLGSVAAGIAVKEWLASSGHAGTIRVYGTPAEEGGSGKVYQVRAGLYNDVDATIHWHPGDSNEVGADSNLANISAKFRFHGVSSHAAADPERGRSALDAVEVMNYIVNMMREHVPQETRIHYIITRGGFAPNSVPDFAESYMYARQPSMKVLDGVWQRIIDAAKAAALGTGTTMDFELIGGTYNILPNDYLSDVQRKNLQIVGGFKYTPEEQAFAEKIAKTFPADPTGLAAPVGSQEIVQPARPGIVTMASADTGDVTWVAPSVGLTAATFVPGTPGHSWQAVSIGGTSIGTKGMLVAVKTMALTAYDLFTSPEHIQKARAEFDKRRGSFTYKAQIGDRKPPLDYRK